MFLSDPSRPPSTGLTFAWGQGVVGIPPSRQHTEGLTGRRGRAIGPGEAPTLFIAVGGTLNSEGPGDRKSVV